MDYYEELVEKAIKEYGMKTEAAVRYAKATIAAEKFAASKEFRVAQQLAEKTGLTVAEILHRGLDKEFPDGNIPEDAAKAIVTPVLQHNYTVVSEVAESVQKDVLEEAGLGINPVVPPFNKERADGIAKAVANGASAAEFEKIVVNHSQNIVDESIKENAKVHQQMGLEPRVTRIYDGIGVHNRKDPCAWCKARAGVDMPYNEAYAKGSFERHPGCGCEILYKVGKRIQRQSDWTHNEWEDIEHLHVIDEISQEHEDLSISDRLAILKALQSEDAVKPFNVDDYEGFNPLQMSDELKEAFIKLNDLSREDNCEHGLAFYEGGKTDYQSSGLHSKVLIKFPKGASHVEVFHSHTNDSVLSREDILKIGKYKEIDRIGNISINGDVWIIDTTSGFRPADYKELADVIDSCYNDSIIAISNDARFPEWTEEERYYMLLRERLYRVCNYYEWTVFGGNIYDQ